MSDFMTGGEEEACAAGTLPALMPAGRREGAGPREEALLHSLLETYYPAIVAFARRKLGNAHDAEDVAQETFAKIHQGLSGFSGRGRLTTWLYTVGRNAVYDCLRRRRRLARITSWTEDLDRMYESKDSPAELPGEDGRLTRLVSRLSQAERRMIFWVFHEQMSLRQIASELGEPLHRVRRRLQKILTDLRAITEDDLR
jgi:RNA polymerase sigma-70 factor (ECF subfamily)